MYMLERWWWWGGKMLYGADVSVCICVCLCESEADFSPLTLEGCLRSGWQQMLMFVLACSVGVWCLLSVRCMTEVLMQWVVQAAAHCEETLRSPGLASCAVAAGSIHHNLTFNWRGARSERKRRQQRKREKETKL